MRSRQIIGAIVLAISLLWSVFLGMAYRRAELHAPPATALVRDARGQFVAEIPGETQGEFGYWRVAALPPRVVAATLALEDRRFYDHPGVDVLAVGRALRQALESREVISGASTLAMQVARMQDPGPRTLPRKALEALTALLLTDRYGRDAILAQYLLLAPYGNRIHGMEYAARRYLDKPVADLSWAEIAYLSAMPQAPSRTNPFRPDGRARALRRGARILTALHREGWLNADEERASQEELRQLVLPRRETRPPWAMHAILRFDTDFIPVVGDPMVTATLDLELQQRVEAHARAVVREYRWRGAENAAVMVVQRRDFSVRAAVGSIDYLAPEGALDYTRTPRQPGSTLKPFLYAMAMDRGILSPDDVLDDIPLGPESHANYDGRFLGPLLPRIALANSRNIPAIQLFRRIGLHRVYGLYRALGLHDDALPAEHFGSGLAVGGMPVTLEALVTAYTTLAGNGRVQRLRWREDEKNQPGERIFHAETAAQLTHMLADPQARLPSFPRLGAAELPLPVAYKTGTSPDYRDAWIFAWTRDWLVGVWVGDPSWRPMRDLSGGVVAAEIARRVLRELHPDAINGASDLGFEPPKGWVSAALCADTGHLDQGACPRVVTEWFRPGQAPDRPDTAHRVVRLDRRTGAPATAKTPAKYLEIRRITDLGPRYAEWLAGCAASGDGPANAALGAPVAQNITEEAIQIRITSPSTGLRVRRDPDLPAALSTLPLKVEVEGPPTQVVWEVDGEPWKTVDYPYSARWPIVPGVHTFAARLATGAVRTPTVRVIAE